MIFHLQISHDLIGRIVHHAERSYPLEACGLVMGEGDRASLVMPMKNVAQDAAHAFRLDALEHLALASWADEAGLIAQVLYHTHCDKEAYFSLVDRSMFRCGGQEVLPGAIQLVLSVVRGGAAGARAFHSDEKGRFKEVAVPLTPRSEKLR